MCKQRCLLLPAKLSLATCLLQLAIPCGMELGLWPGEHIVRRDIADGPVKAHGVVVIHVVLNQTQCIFPGQWCKGANALRF